MFRPRSTPALWLQAIVLAGWALVPSLHAQLGRGTILGTVTDSSGASVPNASVLITNAGTNVALKTQTNQEGFYTSPGVVIGTYSVEVEAQGFKRYARSGITLELDQKAQVNVRLEVGAATQTIEVQADSTMVDTESATAGKVVSEREIQELPLNGRNAFAMLALTPGVVNNTDAVNAGFGSRGNEVANVSINGGASAYNSFTIDGGNNNNTVLNEVNANPAVESIAEFKVLSNTMSAEYGFTLGGVVNVATKGGTNAYHGTAYDYLRNDALDARNAFARSVPFLRYNQYGGSAGGPVRIPKLYNGRSRTFFFANYEGYLRHNQSTSFATVPTALERAGDFSQTKTAQGALYKIYDPATTTQISNTGWTRTPFPDNAIPQSRFDPVTSKLASYIALPNTTPINLFTNQNNFYNVTGNGLTSHQLMLRFDQRITSRNQMYVRYMDFYHHPLAAMGGVVPWEISGRDDRYKTRNAIISDTHTLSPSMVNDLRLSLARQFFTYQSPSVGGNWPQKLGLPANFPNYMVPKITGTTFSIGGDFPGNFRSGITPQLADSVTKIHGRQTLKFGIELRRNQGNTGNLVPCDSGSWSFSGSLTNNPQSTNGTGYSYAQFLLGAVGSGSITCYGNQTIKNYSASPFIQDDWKATRRLTINIGLRYDYQQPAFESHGRESNFDLNRINPLTGLPGMTLFGTQEPLPRLITDKLDFSPRFGFAYALTSDYKTVFRGGYSIFYASVHNVAPSTDGYGTARTAYQSADGLGFLPSFYFKNGIPFQPNMPLGAALGPNYNIIGNVVSYQPNQHTPRSQQWSASLQRQLGRSWLVEVMYSGNHGVHLISGSYDANQRPDSTFDLQAIPFGALNNQMPNPYAGKVPGVYGNKTIQWLKLFEPYPYLAQVEVRYPEMGNSIYHSGIISVTKRMRGGLSLLASYTWAKLISDGMYSNLDFSSEQTSVSGLSTYQNGLYNRRADRAVDPQSVRHRAVANMLYELPFGKGKRFNIDSRVFQFIAGGWQFNSITAMQVGLPMMVTGANNYRATRPNNTGDTAKLDSPSADQWFNPQVFFNPPIYTAGTTGRTLPDVTRPGFINEDMSLMKHFRATETTRFQFRFETFNTLNKVELGAPNGGFVPGTTVTGATNTSALFGRVFSSRNARQVQLALKYIF
jgi:hypothetical protein